MDKIFMKHIKILIIIFFLNYFSLNTVYSDIEALGNLKGVFVTLKIYDKTPQDMIMPHFDKSKLLKHINDELTDLFRNTQNFKVYKIPNITPRLDINITIKGDRDIKEYYINTEARLKQGSAEWYEQIHRNWDKQTSMLPVRAAEKVVLEAKKNLEQEQVYYNELNNYSSEWIYYNTKRQIGKYRDTLLIAKKQLFQKKKAATFFSAMKLTLTAINISFSTDHILVRKYEKEYEKKQKEMEELISQLEEKDPAPQQQEAKRYIKPVTKPSRNIFYETGIIIKLRNTSDTIVEIYKDESLKNITNLFTNGISAEVTNYKALSNGSFIYKVLIQLKDGTEYTGWIPENIISN